MTYFEQGSGAIPDATTLVAMCELLRSQEASSVVRSLDATPVQQVELPAAVVADEAPSVVLDLPMETAWETQAPTMPMEAQPKPIPPIAEEVVFDWAVEQPAPAEVTPETVEPSPMVEEVSSGWVAEQQPPAEILPLETVEPSPAQMPWDDTAQVLPEQPLPQDEWLRLTSEMGEIPAAPTLYDIFCDEARGHLQTLIAAYAELEANPQLSTSFEMTRAAHTLGGIAATVGLMPLNRLALALEHALMRRDNTGRPDSIEGLETVRQAIITLEAMFAGLARQEAPAKQVQLISALEEIFLAGSEVETVSSWPETPFVEGVSVAPVPVAPTVEAIAPVPQAAMPRLQDELDEQLLPIFLEEAQDQLRELTQLRLWRGDLDSDAQPHAIARLLHTFKGNARMAGAMNLGEFTHLLESRVEDVLRAGSATPAFIDEIENGCDTLAQATERLRLGEAGVPEPIVAAAGEAAVATVSTVAVPLEVERDHDAETGAHRATLRVRADRSTAWSTRPANYPSPGRESKVKCAASRARCST